MRIPIISDIFGWLFKTLHTIGGGYLLTLFLFAIVVKIITEGAEFPVAIECPVEDLSENADMSDGRSYLSLQGTLWEHIEETKNYNICLKGYADLQ